MSAPTPSNHSRRRRRARMATAALAVIGVTAAVASPAHAQDTDGDQLVATYADAIFTRRGTTLHLAPGLVDSFGDVNEVLSASIQQETCQGRFLIVIDVSATVDDPDIDGVDVDALGGFASVAGTFPLEGTITLTPAGRGCADPLEELAVTSPLRTDVAIEATWSNQRGSRPVVYSGADCGGDGICYYRDATARAQWSNDFIGEATARSTEAFFFEGTYSASSAALAVVPSLA